MKKTFSTFFLAIVLAFAAKSQSLTNNPLDPVIVKELIGTWTNQLASSLVIDGIDANTGSISGSYISPSGTSGIKFPLIGWVNTSPADADQPDHVVIVSFSVRWGAIGSVTSWNGYYRANAIVGQWLLASPNSKFSWDHTLVGQDSFAKK